MASHLSKFNESFRANGAGVRSFSLVANVAFEGLLVGEALLKIKSRSTAIALTSGG